MYKECCNKAKHFFAEAMNGEVVVSGRSIGGAHRIPNFGIPVTASILNQIICQGYCDEDVIVIFLYYELYLNIKIIVCHHRFKRTLRLYLY